MPFSKSNQTARTGTGSASFTIERTRDFKLLKRLATDPAIFPWIHDDYFRDPRIWQPPQAEFIVNLVAIDDAGAFGFVIFMPRTLSCYDAHLGFLPRSYGAKALAAFKEMLDWVWQNTTAARLVGEIPVENRRAIAFSERAGFERYGFNPASTLRGGILRDQVCLGISKPKASTL